MFKSLLPRLREKSLAAKRPVSIADLMEDFWREPMVRILSKVTGFKLKHIYELFPSGPGKGACKMAGLPKPTGCV